ncbi:WFIKKN2 [Cordylochernes scorpioides]|uniref:WFIKKN2 n=1 Tax=Cordylochernes scorpioides TaxID=51811 RepID=A0ABY6L0S2_9ARAC|nr:WFIKKN2 [Cordylochernes scorpioides]
MGIVCSTPGVKLVRAGVTAWSQPAKCQEPKAAGRCRGFLYKYYHDTRSGTCKPFTYCRETGNNNVFDSELECTMVCRGMDTKTATCSLGSLMGLCRQKLTRFYYDRSSKSCKTFIYGGCGSNGNNFSDRKQCQDFCAGTYLYINLI